MVKEETKIEEVESTYDKKKSFFDNISTYAKQNQRFIEIL